MNVQLSSSAPERTSVCRKLFVDVDHDELNREIKDELREISERAQQRWNFNFKANTSLDGVYKWEEVSVERTPEFYQDSIQCNRTRVPATPINARISSEDSVLPETPHMDVLERLGAPEATSTPSATELNQVNRKDKLNSGKPAHKLLLSVKRQRTDSPDNNTHITVFFVKKKKGVDRKPTDVSSCHHSPIPLEQTPKKKIR